jgi:hypothetical protein
MEKFMKRYWNNKGGIIFSITFFFFCSILFAFCSLLYPDKLYSGPYLNSAHGNTFYGVNRSATATVAIGYTKGHCGHCHEQHASIGGSEPVPVSDYASSYALFSDNFISQSQGFCFDCHKGLGSIQVSFDRTNYNYSYWFGGDTVNHTSPNNIYDTFNPVAGSSHNLQDILNFVKTQWPDTFKDESNPCNACHNPHLNTRVFPVTRPTDRDNIWGDEPGEKMSDFTAAHGGQYQAPYRYNSTSAYEPDGSTITDGSNLPDYITFCMTCHNATNTIYSSSLGRNLKKIDWTQQSRTYGLVGDYHGAITRCWGVDGMVGATCGSDPANWGSIKDPYLAANQPNYILSCTDCHEPHGSVYGNGDTTPYLLRKTVNGHYNKQCVGGPGNPCTWEQEFCRSCHVHNWHCGGAGSCLNCHNHNSYARCWACTWCATGGVHGHAF